MNLKNRIRTIYWNAGYFLTNTESQPKSKSLVLIFHGIVPNNHLKFNNRFVTQPWFEKLLTKLKQEFNFVSINDIFENNIDPKKFNIAITFDDGYKNNYKYAVPILQKLKIPATFFITTIQDAGYNYLWPDFLDITSIYANHDIEIDSKRFKKTGAAFKHNNISLKQYCKNEGQAFKILMMDSLKQYVPHFEMEENKDFWMLLDKEEIRNIASDTLFTIGSHGYYHNNLANISSVDAKDELINSKRYLENIIQKPVDSFAFPDGSYHKSLIDHAFEIGYKYQLLVSFQFDEKAELHPYVKERFGVHPFLSVKNQISAIKKGSYS